MSIIGNLKDFDYDYVLQRSAKDYNSVIRRAVVYFITDLYKPSRYSYDESYKNSIINDYNLTYSLCGELLKYCDKLDSKADIIQDEDFING